MKREKYILLLLAFLMFAIKVDADSRYLYFDHYQISNGLASNRVSDLTMDSRGFLWVATDCGLSRFDGAVFRNFSKDRYPSLFYDYIYQIAPCCDGSVLISGYNGFLQHYNYAADSFVTVIPKTFCETVGFLNYDKSTNKSYLHSDAGTFSLLGTSNFTRCVPLSNSNDKTFNSLADGVGHLWVQSKKTLSVYDGKTLKLQSQIPLPQSCNVLTPRITLFGKNEVLVYCNYGKLYVYKLAANKVALSQSISLPFKELRDVQVATDGSIWFGTDGEGLWMAPSLASNILFTRIRPYGVSDYDFCKIYSVLADANGNVWVGTQNSGLWRYSIRNKERSFSSHDLGLPNCSASSFCQLPNGHIVATCDGLGLCEFSETTDFIKTYTEKDGLTNRNVTSVCLDKNNHLMVSTWGGGFFEGFPSQNAYHFSQPNLRGFPNEQAKIPFFLHLSPNVYWTCAGGDGVYSNEDGSWKKYPLALGGRPENWPVKIVEGEKGELWIATSASIWRRVNGKMSLFNMDLFVGSDAYTTHDILYVPGYGLLLGTNKGLLQADVKNKTFHQNIFNGNISAMVLDKKNRLLVVENNSILRYNLNPGSEHCEYFPRDFSAQGKNHFVAHSAFCSASGNVYFGTSDGFFCVNENDFKRREVSPTLYFSRVVVDGKVINLKECNNNIYLPWWNSSLSISVDMVDFSKMRRPLVYSMYREDDWTSLGPDQTLSLKSLPTGDYFIQFKQAGCRNFIFVKVHVLAPWWQTWKFRLSCLFFILLLVGWRFYRISRDRRLLKQKVEERTKDLNEALTAKNRIMQVVAHDLKNPVFAIYGALQNLRQKSVATAPAEQTEALDKVIESTRTVQDELGKLLSWATAKQEDLSFQPANINLAELITRETKLLELQAKEKSITLTSSVDVPRYIFADARMLATSIRNVLGNSLKFTPAGKSVTIRAWQDSQFAVVEIKDEGVGMSSEQLDKLQSSSVNTSTNGTSGEKGTGLGIGLAKQYVLANGGTFTMMSELGSGTTTVIKVPLSQMEVAESANATEKESAVEPSVNAELLQGNTVLVVDDDPLIAQNIKSMLEEYVDVLLASNGQEALDVVTSQSVDIVVTDVDMPVMNGFELGKQLLSNPATNHIPVLFLSARSAENDRLTGLLTGAVDYIPKPFSRGELLMKLNNILLLRQRQQQKLLAEIGKVATPAVQTEETPVEAGKMDPYLQKVVDMIGEHYTDMNYSVEQLASDLCTSHITLYRKVKSLSGQTPLDLLTEFRLNRAHQLLTEGKTALQDVAILVGFSDYTYFARKFKARFGCPPKDVIAK